ncbi:LGT_TIGR03299, phage/plasmid-like protein TIGR03299 [uncultured Caudovirales phage]|uniref:LGT_TIGR03299, phage/plasmid-like protein TIGR03299 n=1 Tax=uncultured Caudovirales phage TaxID=2100421 RepID=A0A6J5KHE4_9CAUD|nr:LGT_TIGR03299, phage/plasmid-like protein TIGR03299 [uncultured Caudovirales phage]
MAHELTIRADGYTEMAFVGELPWHGLGQELPEGADMATWRKAAGMDWTIEKSPVYYQDKDSVGTDFKYGFIGQNVLYRSDTKAPMSVVSDRYKPVQPAEVLDFFKDLVEESGFRLHTAGTLFGGKRLWALAETGKFGEVTKGDGVGGFLLLSTSCDKSLATTARFTSIRVVCNNTLSMATEGRKDCVSFNHSRAFDHNLMKAKLGLAVESFGAFMEMGKYLQSQKLKQAQATEFVRQLVLNPAQLHNEEYEYTKHRGFVKIMSLFTEEAKGIELVGQTKWGMLNAVTEYFDHHLPARTDDARLNNAWFDTGNTLKAKAIQMLVA